MDILSPLSLFTPFAVADATAPGEAAPLAPDPAETAWTIGPGGAVTRATVAAGFDLTLATTLLNAGVAVGFDPSATLAAAVFRGDGEPALFAPTAAWIDPAAGTLTLAIAANQTATLDPGEYRLQVAVASAGTRYVAYDGSLTITGSAGSGSAPAHWCSSHDILLRSTHAVNLLANRKVDSAGFGTVIAEVTAEVRRMLIDRYDPRPGFIKTRQETPHRLFGLDVPTPGATIPGKEGLAAALDAGGLILEPRIREIVARLAIAMILRRQATTAGGDEYARAAEEEEAMAHQRWDRYRAQVDLDADGVPDALIYRDVTLLPPGVSP